MRPSVLRKRARRRRKKRRQDRAKLTPVETADPQGMETPDDDRVDINTAASDKLTEVPGIGGAIADRIIDHRPYATVGGLTRVPGIGAAKLDDIREYVTV